MAYSNTKPTLTHPLSVVGRQQQLPYSVATDASVPPLLLKLLSVKSPTKIVGIESKTTEKIIHEFLQGLTPSRGTSKSAPGNIIVRIGNTRDHGTVFTSHMDTMHREEGMNTIIVDKQGYLWAQDINGNPDVLGADDKVGVYIMLKMIKHGVPGMYIFHVGEESGGVGSFELASKCAQFFNTAKRCISFDRKGTTSVITRQARGECCSPEFAEALVKQLGVPPMPAKVGWEPDPTGTFTDSANYMGLIPECTNLSVGYYSEHTVNECQDLVFLEEMLLPTLLKVEWQNLPTVRSPVQMGPRPIPSHKANNQSTYTPPPVGIADWKNVNLVTPYIKVPDWNIFTGAVFPQDASQYAVQRMLEKQMLTMGFAAFAKDLAALLDEYENSIYELMVEGDENAKDFELLSEKVAALEKENNEMKSFKNKVTEIRKRVFEKKQAKK